MSHQAHGAQQRAGMTAAVPVTGAAANHAAGRAHAQQAGWHKAAAWARELGGVAYIAVVFWCCIQREPRWWTLLPFIVPLGYWLGVFLLGRVQSQPLRRLMQGALLAAGVLLVVGLVHMQSVFMLSPQRVRLFYFLQEAVMLWLVVAVFARSLLPGKVPLCSAVAVLSHPVMTPAVWRYTRGVTWAWALWIAALWLVSAVLFVAASAQVWASFSMGVLPVLLAVFFMAEVVLGRRLFLPKADRSSLLATLQTVRKVNWPAFFAQLFQGQGTGAQPRSESASSAGGR